MSICMQCKCRIILLRTKLIIIIAQINDPREEHSGLMASDCKSVGADGELDTINDSFIIRYVLTVAASAVAELGKYKGS